ncbi:MAG: class I SAM-dependent rRNA methyltransferase [Deltaproteobacteria bacterium]|nr:class I SAM-dependent rRNA methyltransferase [Deltaproteobacteria bacterium]
MIPVVARPRPGHPWIFSNEIVSPPVISLPPGGAVEVRDPGGKFIGRGYANPRSLISIRLYCGPHDSPDDPALFESRVREALFLRARVVPGRKSYRLVAGEADGLPGLVVDRYDDVLSAQVTSLGMEQRRDQVRAALEAVIAPRGVVFRGDVKLRELEGLPLEKGVWWGDVPERVPFEENGVRYEADLVGGQKTGFFFDQAENRAWMASRCAGARVLDVFAHMGGWALTGLVNGASAASTIESSPAANALIRRNAELNGVSIDVIEGDAREEMARLPPGSFDIVCVDPPAFAKNRKSAGAALPAYKAVNAAGARLVRPGGLLFASSCSHHVEPERFAEAVHQGARQAGRRLARVRVGGQAADHPVLPGARETEYLKHMVFVVR